MPAFLLKSWLSSIGQAELCKKYGQLTLVTNLEIVLDSNVEIKVLPPVIQTVSTPIPNMFTRSCNNNNKLSKILQVGSSRPYPYPYPDPYPGKVKKLFSIDPHLKKNKKKQ